MNEYQDYFSKENNILEECLYIFLKKNQHDGNYTWEKNDFKYNAYYDDDFKLQINKKRMRT